MTEEQKTLLIAKLEEMISKKCIILCIGDNINEYIDVENNSIYSWLIPTVTAQDVVPGK